MCSNFGQSHSLPRPDVSRIVEKINLPRDMQSKKAKQVRVLKVPCHNKINCKRWSARDFSILTELRIKTIILLKNHYTTDKIRNTKRLKKIVGGLDWLYKSWKFEESGKSTYKVYFVAIFKKLLTYKLGLKNNGPGQVRIIISISMGWKQ